MHSNEVTLETLEAYMAARRNELTFPPAIEALYNQQMQSYRLKVMRRGIWPAVFTYNIYLIADALLLPDTFILAAFLHFAVVTPTIFIVGLFYPKAKSQWLREVAATAIPFLMVAQIMTIYSLNRSDAADHYQYLAIMIVVYMNVNQRFGFRLAMGTTILLMTTYFVVLLPGHSAFTVKFIGVCLMTSGAYLSLMASRRMERDVRHAYLRRLRDQLKREGAEEVARRDPLTGLANRRLFDETVAKLWSSADEAVSPVAVVVIDIDHFKLFNDRYGHAAGDTCLKRVSGAIAAELRNDDDLAVRLGGEEFLMLLPRTELSDAIRIAERVRRHIESLAIPHEHFGPRGVVTASLGVMAGPVSAESASEVVASADASLYAAKRNGRNQVWPPFVSKDNPVASLFPVSTTETPEADRSDDEQAESTAPHKAPSVNGH